MGKCGKIKTNVFLFVLKNVSEIVQFMGKCGKIKTQIYF
jgi:hypothetical protein